MVMVMVIADGGEVIKWLLHHAPLLYSSTGSEANESRLDRAVQRQSHSQVASSNTASGSQTTSNGSRKKLLIAFHLLTTAKVAIAKETSQCVLISAILAKEAAHECMLR